VLLLSKRKEEQESILDLTLIKGKVEEIIRNLKSLSDIAGIAKDIKEKSNSLKTSLEEYKKDLEQGLIQLCQLIQVKQE
jgi:hypothetical protein